MLDLNVPYLSQLDNLYEPNGTCNTTSVAMVMQYFGIQGDGSGLQLEDQLTKKCWTEGWDRHSPTDLVKLFKWKGIKDKFRSDGELSRSLRRTIVGAEMMKVDDV